jgi:hypothetical protein
MSLSLAIGPSPASPAPADPVGPSVKLEPGLFSTRARPNSLVVGEKDHPRYQIQSGQSFDSVSGQGKGKHITPTHALTKFDRLGLVLEEQQPCRIRQGQSGVCLFVTRSDLAPSHPVWISHR